MECNGDEVPSASCYVDYTFGYGELTQAGTYTYRGMNARDKHSISADGSNQWNSVSYENNPFNVPDLVVQGN